MRKFANTPPLAAECFATASGLDALRQGARAVRHLEGIWHAIAPAPLARASHPGLPEDGVLPIFCDNGAVAARLRQIAPRLEQQLSQRTRFDLRIAVRVRSKPLPQPAPAAPPRQVSAQAQSRLKQLHIGLEQGRLRDALTRLLQHLPEPDRAD